MVAVKTAEASQVLEQLADTVDNAMSVGCSLGAIVEVVTNRITAQVRQQENDVPELPDPSDDYVLSPDGTVKIYNQIPPGMVLVPTAAERYQCSVRTIRDWANSGRVEIKGRLRGRAGGGGMILLSESELVTYMASPRDKGGRPKKSERHHNSQAY